MHKCPHCSQELGCFAFFCIRCSKRVGHVEVDGEDGVMLAMWWLDANGDLFEKILVKTLMIGDNTVDAKSLEFVSSESGVPYVLITLTQDNQPRRQDIVEFFRQAINPTQEWRV